MKIELLEKRRKPTDYFGRTLTGYFDFCSALEQTANHIIKSNQTPVFFCIGSDRITGDCLGPLVGHKLKEIYPEYDGIYGTLEHPVHARNMVSILNQTYRKHTNPFFIAIDASVGTPKHIGCITLTMGGLSPGEGVKKKLPPVGDISITGIVNCCQGNTGLLLQNTRLYLVNELADFISMGIANGFASYLY